MKRLSINIEELNDQQLIALVKSGSLNESRDAMAAIYQCYKMDVWRFVRSKVNNDAVADDISMDAWTHIIDNIHNFEWQDGEGNKLKSWLFRIAHFKRLEYFRANPANEELDELTDTQEMAKQYIAERLKGFDEDDRDGEIKGNQPRDVLRVADRIIQTALDTLPDEQRQIILLIYYHNVETATEVAEILGYTSDKKGASKVRGYHRRALKKLAKNAGMSNILGRKGWTR